MSTRPTPEDRLMAELAWQAVQDKVPPDERVAYMDALRGTLCGRNECCSDSTLSSLGTPS